MPLSKTRRLVWLLAASLVTGATSARAQRRGPVDPEAVKTQTTEALAQLTGYLNGIGFEMLDARAGILTLSIDAMG